LLLIVPIVLITCFVAISLFNYPSKDIKSINNLNKKELDQLISNYIINYNISRCSKSGKQFEAHNIYGMEKDKGLIKIYIYSLFEEYSFVDGKLSLLSGEAHPALIVLKKENNYYKVIQYKEPEDIEGNLTSYKSILPSKYARKVLRDTWRTTELAGEIKRKATAWFKEIGKSELILE